MKNYVKDMEPQILKARQDRVFITHSGCDPELYAYMLRLKSI